MSPRLPGRLPRQSVLCSTINTTGRCVPLRLRYLIPSLGFSRPKNGLASTSEVRVEVLPLGPSRLPAVLRAARWRAAKPPQMEGCRFRVARRNVPLPCQSRRLLLGLVGFVSSSLRLPLVGGLVLVILGRPLRVTALECLSLRALSAVKASACPASGTGDGGSVGGLSQGKKRKLEELSLPSATTQRRGRGSVGSQGLKALRSEDVSSCTGVARNKSKGCNATDSVILGLMSSRSLIASSPKPLSLPRSLFPGCGLVLSASVAVRLRKKAGSSAVCALGTLLPDSRMSILVRCLTFVALVPTPTLRHTCL